MAEVDVGAVAPAAPVVPASTDAPAPQVTATPEAQPEGGEKPEAPPERTFTQKEVDEIAAKRAAQAERRALKIARAEAERDYYKSLAEKAQAPQPQELTAPRPDQFKDYEDYLVAKAKHEFRAEQKQAQEQRERQQSEHQSHSVMASKAQALKAKFEAAAEKLPDLEDRIRTTDMPFTQAMVDGVIELDNGADVTDHLLKNPKEAVRIANLGPAAQILALAEIGRKLTQPPVTTSAPPPIKPNPTNASADKDPHKMSDKEFAEWRKRQIAQRR